MKRRLPSAGGEGSHGSGIQHGADVEGSSGVQAGHMIQDQWDQGKVDSSNATFLALASVVC